MKNIINICVLVCWMLLWALDAQAGNTPTAQTTQAQNESAQPLSQTLQLELPSAMPALESDGVESVTRPAAESVQSRTLPARGQRALDGKARKPWQLPSFHAGKRHAQAATASSAPQDALSKGQFNLKLFLIVVLVVVLVLVLLSLLGIPAGLVITVALLVALIYVLLLLLGLV